MSNLECIPEGCQVLKQIESENGNPVAVWAAINNKLSSANQRERALRIAGVIDSLSVIELAVVAINCPNCGPCGEGCQGGSYVYDQAGLERDDLRD